MLCDRVVRVLSQLNSDHRRIDTLSPQVKTLIEKSLSREELLTWAKESLAFYRLPLERISSVFLMQAYASEANRLFDTFDLVRPIKLLEGLGGFDDTPKADEFKDPLLIGLRKKHFTSPRFIARNLSNFLRSKFGVEYFERIFREAAAASGSGYVDDVFAAYLAHHMTMPPLEMRGQAGKFTGEWVVFYTHESKNYYLCLGFHGQEECNRDSNRRIRDMVDIACEFDNLPFRLSRKIE